MCKKERTLENTFKHKDMEKGKNLMLKNSQKHKRYRERKVKIWRK